MATCDACQRQFATAKGLNVHRAYCKNNTQNLGELELLRDQFEDFKRHVFSEISTIKELLMGNTKQDNLDMTQASNDEAQSHVMQIKDHCVENVGSDVSVESVGPDVSFDMQIEADGGHRNESQTIQTEDCVTSVGVDKSINIRDDIRDDLSWQLPKYPLRKTLSEPDVHGLSIQNRFNILQQDHDNHITDELTVGAKQPIERGAVAASSLNIDCQTKVSRKASKVVPGYKSYNKAHVKNTLILSDSMTSKIRAKHLNSNIDCSQENVIMKKYPGATTTEIAAYAEYQIGTIRPSRLVLIGGTNDIGYDSKAGVPNEYSIVENLIKTGVFAREQGAEEVYISSIICRRGRQYDNCIKRVNSLLYARCLENSFIFIDQSNIKMSHLHDDGLHLNYQGIRYMKLNILKCFYSFNPFLCNFWVSTTDGLANTY